MERSAFREPKRETRRSSRIVRIPLEDLGMQKRLSNVSNFYSLILPFLVCMERQEEFILFYLLTNKLDSDVDEAPPLQLSSIVTVSQPFQSDQDDFLA